MYEQCVFEIIPAQGEKKHTRGAVKKSAKKWQDKIHKIQILCWKFRKTWVPWNGANLPSQGSSKLG